MHRHMIRSPHDATVMINVGTTAQPLWQVLYLWGVKIDLITGLMVQRHGYDKNDKVRMMIYLQDVTASWESWDKNIPDGSYFTKGIIDPPETPGEWKKVCEVWRVTASGRYDALLPIMHHLEIVGR